jgi:hypothetical protein
MFASAVLSPGNQGFPHEIPGYVPQVRQGMLVAEAFWPTQRTMDGGTMPEAPIKTQALLIWSEPDRLCAYYKQFQYGQAVILLAIPRRVGFSP